MIERLEKLSALYDTRLQAARQALIEPMRALAEIDRELAVADQKLSELAAQRGAWEQQWQHWLNHDGVLCRGEEYNRFHVRLAALEEDLQAERAEILERRHAAQENVDAARKTLWKCQQRVDQMVDVLAPARRERRLHVEAIRARDAEEVALLRHAGG